jgi:cysteine desulfurase
MRPVYLDNNATTRVAPEVLEAMLPYFGELYGNPSSMHSFGGQVARKVREAREQVAALLGAQSDEILFTSCGTESDNTAIRAALATNPDRRHIVMSRVEHPAVKALGASLAKEGYRVTELPVDREGCLDLDLYEKALTPDTAIVSLMWANNETGVLFPVEAAAALARQRGIVFHTDAVQAVGKIPVDMQGNDMDMLSLSGPKLHAPRASVSCMSAEARGFPLFWSADTRSGSAEAGRRTRRGLSGWARPVSWRRRTCPLKTAK